MTKRQTDQINSHEEVIITLPATALDALGVSLNDQFKNGYDTGEGDMYLNSSVTGRDKPFPCFKKSQWHNQTIIKLVQQRHEPIM